MTKLKLYKNHQFLTSVNWHRVMIEAEGLAIYCYHYYRSRYVYLSSSLYTQCALLVTRSRTSRHIYRAIIRDRYPLVRLEFLYRVVRYILAQESLWFIRTIQYPRELYQYLNDWLLSRFVMDQWLKEYLLDRLWALLMVD
jgi:hypothetical protein